ncbi:MAG: hypothetical protein IPJ69_07235 [Deltaproteobacteria bacterium]|nr:MAG: hypothetical protein IPJ69_07235 [Deltaproteobacteria bacterium]
MFISKTGFVASTHLFPETGYGVQHSDPGQRHICNITDEFRSLIEGGSGSVQLKQHAALLRKNFLEPDRPYLSQVLEILSRFSWVGRGTQELREALEVLESRGMGNIHEVRADRKFFGNSHYPARNASRWVLNDQILTVRLLLAMSTAGSQLIERVENLIQTFVPIFFKTFPLSVRGKRYPQSNITGTVVCWVSRSRDEALGESTTRSRRGPELLSRSLWQYPLTEFIGEEKIQPYLDAANDKPLEQRPYIWRDLFQKNNVDDDNPFHPLCDVVATGCYVERIALSTQDPGKVYARVFIPSVPEEILGKVNFQT